MRRLALAAALVITVLGCGCGQTGSESGGNGGRTPGALKTYEAPEWGFELPYDAGRFSLSAKQSFPFIWDLSGEQSEGEDETHYVSLLDRKTPDNTANVGGTLDVMVMTIPIDVGHHGEALLKSYVEDSRAALRDAMPGVKIATRKETLECGELAWVYRFEGPEPNEGFEATALVFHAIEGNHMFRIQLAAPTEVWQAEEPVLRSVLAGLVIDAADKGDDSGSNGGRQSYVSTKYDFAFKYPDRLQIIAEEAAGKGEFTVQLCDTKASMSIRVAVFVGPAPITIANAESDGLDYSPVVEGVAKQDGVSKVMAPTLVTVNGLKAWQYDYLGLSKSGIRVRTRAIDIWDGKRLYSMVLVGRRGQWTHDIAALMVVPRTFTLQ